VKQQPTTAGCAICGALGLRDDFRTPELRVTRCPSCGHRYAEHAPSAGRHADTDYHLQYEQQAFVSALERTRVRQAQRIVGLIRRHMAEADSVLDYGAGRGWFLDVARSAGFVRSAGADPSAVSARLLRERGFEALELTAGAELERSLPRASFEPQVLTLLDVIEHFPPATVRPTLRQVLRHFRPRLAVFKVPLSSGLLYRSARGLCACGVRQPLEQLYQVGSRPPHVSYFSRRSLSILLASCGLRVIDELLDLDFEPQELAGRASALRRLGGLARGLGAVAAVTANRLRCQDSLIAIARFSA
jgi:hypothetical protein